MLDSSTIKHVISSSLAVPLTKKFCYKSTMLIEVEVSLNNLSLHYGMHNKFMYCSVNNNSDSANSC